MVFTALFCASPFDLHKVFVATDLGLDELKLASEGYVAFVVSKVPRPIDVDWYELKTLNECFSMHRQTLLRNAKTEIRCHRFSLCIGLSNATQ